MGKMAKKTPEQQLCTLRKDYLRLRAESQHYRKELEKAVQKVADLELTVARLLGQIAGMTTLLDKLEFPGQCLTTRPSRQEKEDGI